MVIFLFECQVGHFFFSSAGLVIFLFKCQVGHFFFSSARSVIFSFQVPSWSFFFFSSAELVIFSLCECQVGDFSTGLGTTPRWDCSCVWCPLGVVLWRYQLGVLTPRWECSCVWCPLGVFLWGYQLGVRSEVPVGSADWEAVPVGSAGRTWPAQSSLFCNVRRLVRFVCHRVGQLCPIGHRRYAVSSVRSCLVWGLLGAFLYSVVFVCISPCQLLT